MQIDDLYYYYKCLPMGCAISCQLFENVSSDLDWIMANYFHEENIVHVKDDFFLVGIPSREQCLTVLQNVLKLCQHLVISIKRGKTFVFPLHALHCWALN